MGRIIPITDRLGDTPKDETTFHLFDHLPPEIRREIYILATPPRVVYVKEVGKDSDAWQDRCDEFKETCRTTPVQFRLHPDLTYFAHNWAPRLGPRLCSHNQLLLEAYGFTSTKRPYQAWVPTEDTPEIPSSWLADNPNTAWAMARDTSLYSSAPIPPFLHVCSESREMLKRYGYELAFGTRTDEPQTWFHFERDTLYVDRFSSDDDEGILVGEGCNVGLFRPMDLQRVKRLAIAGEFEPIPRYNGDTSETLRLIPNLKDLFLIIWNPENMKRYWDDDNNKTPNPKSHHVCVSVDELDFIPSLSERDRYTSSRSMYRHVKGYKSRSGPVPDLSRSSFDYAESRFRELLINDRQRLMISNHRDQPTHPWNVPRVHFAHVCSLEVAGNIFLKRRLFWNRFNTTKSRLAHGRMSKRQAVNEESRHIPEYMDIGEAFLRANEPDKYERWEFFLAHCSRYYGRRDFTVPVSAEELWWLTKAVVFPPQLTIL
ncbi:uncharacterized protein GGS22DRAFT_119910 [Annulohypoxylon maeteangense]|uniref:uncharacterized protein n=1 Tax=Annulohypoxylon maeteangense TaxID=1927788 RepID=UPI002008E048|nr:uncharacterized protein GGS22DRAFT_119910 [Annulohypoxylon maeteangense]KAI0886984.1 hypothetical protein GGS22DRAFT_119910 [Annulohypoxylon maeteangense]